MAGTREPRRRANGKIRLKGDFADEPPLRAACAARWLLLGQNLDAASTGYRVGYEDAPHFSREYNRSCAPFSKWVICGTEQRRQIGPFTPPVTARRDDPRCLGYFGHE